MKIEYYKKETLRTKKKLITFSKGQFNSRNFKNSKKWLQDKVEELLRIKLKDKDMENRREKLRIF